VLIGAGALLVAIFMWMQQRSNNNGQSSYSYPLNSPGTALTGYAGEHDIYPSVGQTAPGSTNGNSASSTPPFSMNAMTRQYGGNASYDFPNNQSKGLPLVDVNGNNVGYVPFNSPIQLTSPNPVYGINPGGASYQISYKGSNAYLGGVDIAGNNGSIVKTS